MSEQNLLELLARVGTQPLLTPQAICLVAQAAASRPSVIKMGADLNKEMRLPVVISAASEGNGYEGGLAWGNFLVNAGVSEKDVLGFEGARIGDDFSPQSCNTLTEMAALVRHLKREKVTDVLLVAPAFHLPRAIVSFATACHNEAAIHLFAWGIPVSGGSWDERIVHSQGTLGGRTSEIFAAELDKIAGPRRFQNLLSVAEVLDWMNRRDHFCSRGVM